MSGLEFLYKTKDVSTVFGSHFCGPDKYEHGKETLVAKFEKDPKNDGYEVEVYCTSMPADFYSVIALDSNNSIGELMKGFKINFGSSCLEPAYVIAKLLNDGMMGVYQDDKRL